jgi:hypothetical protein
MDKGLLSSRGKNLCQPEGGVDNPRGQELKFFKERR